MTDKVLSKNTLNDFLYMGGMTIGSGIVGTLFYKAITEGAPPAWEGVKSGWTHAKPLMGQGVTHLKDASYFVGRNIKEYAGAGWENIKWTADRGGEIAPTIPGMIQESALSLWGAGKGTCFSLKESGKSVFNWGKDCFFHPKDSIVSTFHRCVRLGIGVTKAIWNIYERYILVNLEMITSGLWIATKGTASFVWSNVDFALQAIGGKISPLGRLGNFVKETTLSFFNITSSKAAQIRDAVLPYSPLKAFPEMTNPTYSALAATAIALPAPSLAEEFAKLAIEEPEYLSEKEEAKEDRKILAILIRIAAMILGVGILAPKLAQKLSSHTITRLEATGWSLPFAALSLRFTPKTKEKTS